MPFWFIGGNGTGSHPGNPRCYGPPWSMHILAYMEENSLDGLVNRTISSGSELNEACPWNNIDGTGPANRPDTDIQNTMKEFMRCPSAEQSDVEFSNRFSLENIRKGNYAACFGGDSFIHATPAGNPNSRMLGVFGVVNSVTKASRVGSGKGTRLGEIADGTSNTLAFSEVLAWHQTSPTLTNSRSPGGINQDWRGGMIIPGIGASTFTCKTTPNSAVPDRIPGCETSIPTTNRLRCELNVVDGLTWAAARSSHAGGVNAAFADGSVRFFSDSIAPAVWSGLGTKAGGEVLSNF